MKNIAYLIFLIIGLCSLQNTIQAQGWSRVYPATIPGEGIQSIRQTSDGGYITGGRLGYTSSGHGRSNLVKLNSQGIVQWQQDYHTGHNNSIQSLEQLPDGGYVLVGDQKDAGINPYKPYCRKVDAFGNTEWLKEYSSFDGIIRDVEPTSDAGFILAGESTANAKDLLLIKTDSLGDTLWTKSYSWQYSDYATSIKQTTDGGYIVAGEQVTSPGNVTYFLMKTDVAGDSTWFKTFGLNNNMTRQVELRLTPDNGYVFCGSANGNLFIVKTDSNGVEDWSQDVGGIYLEQAYGIDLTLDGGYVMTGRVANGTNIKMVLTKFDANGNQAWMKFFGGDVAGEHWEGASVQTVADGFIIGGTVRDNGQTPKNGWFVKTDSLGRIYNNTISGNIYDDQNGNCQLDSAEFRFENRIVKAVGHKTFYAVTDANGFYSMDVDTGTYQVILVPSTNHSYWATSCTGDTASVSIPNANTFIDVHYPQTALVLCPLMSVDVSTPFLRRCFPNNYSVQYCNNGTVDEYNAAIQIEFDPFLIIDTTTIMVPWTDLGNNVYAFQIDTVLKGQCGSFNIGVEVDCDSTILGQTHCVVASITPDTLCIQPPWTGPQIQLEVECLGGDSVMFTIQNVGGNMSTALNYLVYEDNVMVRPGAFQLNSGQSEQVTLQTIGGATYRMEAQQALGFPAIMGDSLISLAIEGCGLDPLGNFNTGFVTQLPNFDGFPSMDIDCQENIGAYDPNDKRGFPKGYGPQHYIRDYTQLDYHIRFQNTGTDTAFHIYIRDTLSSYLDISTLETGTSSHPYTLNIYGQDQIVLEFVFNNIQLPDSNINEAASHGFVKFHIHQVLNNPLGTIIENQAAIYFDFNPPIFTNTTFHEVGEDFIPIHVTGTENVLDEAVNIQVFPNPFHDVATFKIEGKTYENINFELYDLSGKLVQRSMVHQQNSFEVHRNNLNNGLYIYRIEANGKLLNTGKISVQ